MCRYVYDVYIYIYVTTGRLRDLGQTDDSARAVTGHGQSPASISFLMSSLGFGWGPPCKAICTLALLHSVSHAVGSKLLLTTPVTLRSPCNQELARCQCCVTVLCMSMCCSHHDFGKYLIWIHKLSII